MPDIFLSYKRQDAPTAARLVAGLRDVGFDVWWDIDIPAGAAWEATIERALQDASVVLVCWSRAAITSDNVRSEARWAREQNRLIQLFVEPCEPPLFFGERQGLDMAHWSGDPADPRFHRLVAQVRARLSGPSEMVRVAPVVGPPPGRNAPGSLALATWLKRLDLDHYAGLFEAAEVDLATLRQLDEADLKEMGVPLGPRKNIMAALAAAPAEVAAATTPPDRPVAQVRPSVAERRQITVMSVDLADAPRLSAALDPEVLADLLARYKDGVALLITAAGGWVAKSAGDSMLAYFGWPQAQEDAAQRATRAGLQVVAEIGRLADPEGRPLRGRVGIATGLVVVGGARADTQDVPIAGEAPNIAVSLNRLALPDTVVIAERTYRQVDRIFDCERLPEQVIGGRSAAIRLWRVARELPYSKRFKPGRTIQTSFVGRTHELSLLADRWRTAAEGHGRTVVVLAEAGMGKSRLADALQHHIGDEPHDVVVWQCSSYHQTKAFYPVVDYLTHAAGIADTDSPAQQLQKLAGLLVAAQMPLDGNLALIAQLLAIDGQDAPALPDLLPNQVRAATIAALTEWMQRLAAAKPLLFLLEDAHWIDATTLEFLARLVGAAGTLPLLIVITARPEFISPWSGRAEVSTIGLDRLPDRVCEALAREVVGSATIRNRTVEEIVARSDGNPLFVEQLSAAVGDADGQSNTVPDSLQSSLMARLDRLGDAKQTAQLCSVLGRRFARPLLVHVTDMTPTMLDTNLALLVDHDVIRPIVGGGEGRYEFKHALVRDAAYESMLLSQRRSLHLACGRSLEQSFPDVARTEPELLAQHFGLAGEAHDASAYAELAGDRATAACAFREAIANYEEALRQNDVLPVGPAHDRRALYLLLKIGPALAMLKGPQDVEFRDIYRRAETLSRTTDDIDALFKSVWGLWYHANISRDLGDARGLAEQLVVIGEQSGDDDLALEALHCRWSSNLFRADYADCVADAQRGVALYDQDRHHQLGHVFGGHDPGVCAMGCQGQATAFAGHVEAGLALSEQAIALGEALGHPGSIAHGLLMGLITSTVVRAPERSRTYAERMLELARRFDLPPQQAMGAYHLAWVEAEVGDRTKGLDDMAALYGRVTAIGPITLLYKVMFIEQLLGAGRVQEALAVADQAIADLRVPDMGLELSELLRLRGDCLAALGRCDEAVRELTRAEAMATRDGAALLRLRAANSLFRAAGGDAGQSILHAALLAMPGDWNGPDVMQARALLSA